MTPELATLRSSSRALLCLECGKCSTLCPLAAFGGFSAARMVALREPERELAGRQAGRAAAIERCLTCAACETRCPQQVRFTEFVRGVRHAMPAADRHPCPHGQVFQAAARAAAGQSGARRPLAWLDGGRRRGPGAPEPLRVAESGEIGLFVGCLPLFDVLFGDDDEVRPLEIARAAVRLLNRLGIEPVLVAEERCCGHDLLWSGDEETFGRLAEANATAFEARGVKHLLTTCAECCRTWRLDYPEAAPGYRPRVEHLSEFLAERQAKSAPDFDAIPSIVTYQDPCRLGRQLGVVEAPRRLLEGLPGAELREMEHTGLDAQCCGTPGFLYCDAVSRRLQEQRLASAAATGAATLLTACPKCLIHFACAQREDRRRGRERARLDVQDLTVFAAARLRDPAPAGTDAGEPATIGGSP